MFILSPWSDSVPAGLCRLPGELPLVTHIPCALRAHGWPLTGRAMMYPEAQKVGGQNEGVWRSQNDCRPQAEGQRAQSLQSGTV